MFCYAQGNKMHQDNGERDGGMEGLRAVLPWPDTGCHRVGAGDEQDQVQEAPEGPAQEP